MDFAAGRRGRSVFVDDHGRRRRWFRGACGASIAASVLYVALVVVGLTGHGPLAGIQLGPFGSPARSGPTALPIDGGGRGVRPGAATSTDGRRLALAVYVAPATGGAGAGSPTDPAGPDEPQGSDPGSAPPAGQPVTGPIEEPSQPTSPTPPPTPTEPSDPTRGKSVDAPGHNKTTTTAPDNGKSAAAPGHNKTTTTTTDNGKSDAAPGHDPTVTTGNSATAPGQVDKATKTTNAAKTNKTANPKSAADVEAQ